MNQKLLAPIIALLVLVGILVFGGVLGTSYVFDKPPGQVSCTMEAKQCSDGSYVGRTGPNCEFAACPSTAGMGTLEGRVTLSPICPVETFPPNPSCAPKPYQTLVSIRTLSGTVVASVPTDENGYYRVTVKPGEYEVTASGGNPLPRCEDVRVSVISDDINEMNASVNISCDTGIR